MCLLGVVFQTVPDCPVLIIANREEFYSRPTASPRIEFPDGSSPAWLGGVDLTAGGTWLGINAAGLIVAVTNRPKRLVPAGPLRSRGLLCRRLLQARDPQAAERDALRELREYPFAGCNIVIVGRSGGTVIEAGDAVIVKPLEAGVQLITNGDLNAPDDRRIARVRSELEKLAGQEVEQWLTAAKSLCAAPAAGDQPAICLEGPDRGTVSSTLVALPDSPADSRYFYAAGSPSRTPYTDYSPLLRQLLAGTASPDRSSVGATPVGTAAGTAHRIALKGPWDYVPISASSGADALPEPGKAKMPASWQALLGDFRGRVRFERRFHRPSNLDDDESVFLVFEAVGGAGFASLNGHLLGPLRSANEPQRFDVTKLLQGEEQLQVELEFAAPPEEQSPGGLYAPVTLEIARRG